MLTTKLLLEKAREKGMGEVTFCRGISFHHEELNAYLHGHPLEVFCEERNEWIPTFLPFFNKDDKYRIADFKFPYWGVLKKEYKYVAMDVCGSWYAYEEMPTFSSGNWSDNEMGYSSMTLAAMDLPKLTDPYLSLSVRPE